MKTQQIVDRFEAAMRAASSSNPKELHEAAKEIGLAQAWYSDAERDVVRAFVALLSDQAERKEDVLRAAFGKGNRSCM